MSETFLVPNLRRRGRVRIEIVDNFGNASPVLNSTSIADVEISPTLQVVGTGGGIGGIKITAAIDPTFEFRPLVPWVTEGEGSLIELVHEMAQDVSDATSIAPPETVHDEMLSLLSWALPEKAPDSWEISFEPDKLDLDEEQTGFVALRLQTPTPGAAAFAIEATTSDGDAAVSDIVILEVGDDLVPRITYP